MLNDYIDSDEDAVHEKELLNFPDWTARIGFRMQAEEIYE